MVNLDQSGLLLLLLGGGAPADSPAAQPTLLERLDPRSRSAVTLALAALILLGLLLVALAWLGARAVRRQARKSLAPTHLPGDEWSKKPLGQPDPPSE